MRTRTVALFVACALCAVCLVLTHAQAPGAPTHVSVHAPATWTVTPSSASIPAGSTVQLMSSSGNGTTWSSSNQAVATVSGSGLVTGVSEGAVTILARKGNKNGVATITVTPGEATCDYAVSPTSDTFSADGDSVQIDIVTTAGCNWTAVPSAGWLSALPTSGTGSGSVMLSAGSNSGSGRSATATIAGHVVSIFQSGSGGGGVVTAASCSRDDVQAAVSAAVNGDEVQLPACDVTWSGNYPNYLVTWSNKNLTIRGAGIDQTIISCGTANGGPTGGRCFIAANDTDSNAFSQSRFTAMTLHVTAPSGQAIVIRDQESTTSPHSGWRIDHMRLWYDATGSGNAVTLQGAFYAVLDSNVYDWKNQGIVIQGTSGQSYESAGGLTNPVGQMMAKQAADLGTANYTFIETSVFNCSGTNGCAVFDSAGGGTRVVFRNNTVTAGFFNHHWVRGLDWCGILAEIYHNTFTGNSSYSASPVVLESGTALIFENQITGHGGGNISVEDRRAAGAETSPSFLACDGTHAWDGNAGDPNAPGWPCLGQIGRAPGKTLAQIQAGNKQTSLPLHLWLNGADPGCATGGSCTNSSSVFVINAPAYIKATPHSTSGFGNGDADFINGGSTPKVGYTPYQYPHPLTLVP